jgi:hypothetical protein
MIDFTHTKRGWVVPVAVIGGFILAALTRSALHVERGSTADALQRSVILLAAAVLLVALGNRWRRRDGRQVWDARRSKLARLPAGHTFMWIDVATWGWVIAGATAWSVIRPG